jgi:hypothetical protein
MVQILSKKKTPFAFLQGSMLFAIGVVGFETG